MVVLGLVLTLGAGVALGLVGGGGALVIVPTLVFFFGQPPVEATAYSLVLVALASTAGTWLHWSGRPLPLRRVAIFGVASMLAAYAVRAAVMPRLPAVLVVGSFHIERDPFLMFAFSGVAGAAGLAMLRPRWCVREPSAAPAWVPIAGAATGALTGTLGVGGGFLVFPALVLLVGLSVEEAIRSSLLLVAAQSVAGALGAITTMPSLDLTLMLVLAATMLLGVAWGAAAAPHLDPRTLRRLFGWLVLLVAGTTAVWQLA